MLDRVSRKNFGTLPTGDPVDLFTLRNANGMEATITNFGGRLVSLHVPDRQGKFEDVVLGFDTFDGYWKKNPYLGALVGRYANRIANAEFKLNGVTYRLARNNGENSLHGGLRGFDRVLWKAKEAASGESGGVELSYLSKDGEEGYPGNLSVIVTYTLTDANELRIGYGAMTDKDTVLNLTNHSYFDLTGQGGGNILDHEVTIFAERFTPVNEHLIPTGELKGVAGTPFDFRKPTRIATHIGDEDEQLRLGDGYDHNFALRDGHDLAPAARVSDPKSGRILEVLTTEPGVQFYTGNHLDGTVTGKNRKVYGYRAAFCLETQHFPDSPNQPKFPRTDLKLGERFQSTTIFKFSGE
ncbi:MAG TPA: aldose epimerase family protein [Bryobacteraceae bacterium]